VVNFNFGHLNEPTVPCCVDEVSPRLGPWGLVLALCWLVCLFLVCGVVLARACWFVVLNIRGLALGHYNFLLKNIWQRYLNFYKQAKLCLKVEGPNLLKGPNFGKQTKFAFAHQN
jgi:hypothetical protein